MSNVPNAQSGAAESHLAGPNEQRVEATVPDQGITSFRDDTTGVAAQPIDLFSDTRLYAATKIRGAETIQDFLRRPSLLTSGNLTTTDSGKLYEIDPFNALVSGPKLDKLKGVYGIRADIRVVLNVNAVRFQSGRYILAFVPSGGVPVTNAGYVASYKAHATTLTNITQLPHVEIDIATQTHVELLIPWDNVYPFFIVGSLYPLGIGKIFLYPYVALSAASGDTTASYTIWASMENIDLTGPTVTQSGGNWGDRERKAAGIGPVESTLGKVAQASTILGEIPLLSPATKTVSWTAGILARAAHVFGWSKPLTITKTQHVQPRAYRFLGVSDGESCAEPLALVSTTGVVPYPRVGGTKLDEMSIDFIKGIFAYGGKVVWNASHATGTLLADLAIRPNAFNYSYGLGSVPTPVGFLGTMFKWWRGSFLVRFKLVKNEFYSGRLAVYFEPNWHGAAFSSTMANSEFSHRVIVDIRDCTEFEVQVPYISAEVYSHWDVSIGTLQVRVLDPLVAPSSVPTNITLVWEVAGGDDMEFAVPLVPDFEPWIPAATESGFRYIAETQSGYEAIPRHKLGEAVAIDKALPASVCMGEKPESMRQMCKIYNPIAFTAGDHEIDVAGGAALVVRAYQRPVVTQVTSISTAVARGNVYADWLTLISAMYCMETGSMRLTCVPDTVVNHFHGSLAEDTGNGMVTTAVWSALDSRTIRSPVHLPSGGPIDFQVPPYQNTIGRIVASHWECTAVPVLTATGVKTTFRMVTAAGTGAFRTFVARTGADDYNCYGFISCVPMIATSVWS